LRRERLALAVLAVLALAVISCADEASAPTDESGESTPGIPAGSNQAPEPTLEDGFEEVGRSAIVIAPSPGLPYNLTPQEIGLATGGNPPPCDRFSFAFGWLVTDPPEQAPDFDLVWSFAGNGQSEEVGRGPSGVAQVGCGVLTVTNGTGRDISVALNFVVGESQ
jgi:hypothetical protein